MVTGIRSDSRVSRVRTVSDLVLLFERHVPEHQVQQRQPLVVGPADTADPGRRAGRRRVGDRQAEAVGDQLDGFGAGAERVDLGGGLPDRQRQRLDHGGELRVAAHLRERGDRGGPVQVGDLLGGVDENLLVATARRLHTRRRRWVRTPCLP
jgi:hypothetical protein